MRARQLPQPTAQNVDIDRANVLRTARALLDEERDQRAQIARIRIARMRRRATLGFEVGEKFRERNLGFHSGIDTPFGDAIANSRPRSAPRKFR